MNKQGLLENLSDLIAAPRDECTWIFFLILPLCQGHDNFYELPLTFSEMILNVVFSTNYC